MLLYRRLPQHLSTTGDWQGHSAEVCVKRHTFDSEHATQSTGPSQQSRATVLHRKDVPPVHSVKQVRCELLQLFIEDGYAAVWSSQSGVWIFDDIQGGFPLQPLNYNIGSALLYNKQTQALVAISDGAANQKVLKPCRTAGPITTTDTT